MKFRNKMGIVLFIIIAFLIVIDKLTLQRYNIVSGNGNPGFVPIFLLIPFLLWFSINLLRCFSYKTFNKFFLVALPIAILFDIWGWKYQYNKLEYIKSRLMENNIPVEVVNDVTTGITYYTNNVYFNHITFLIFLSLIFTVGIVKSVLSRDKGTG